MKVLIKSKKELEKVYPNLVAVEFSIDVFFGKWLDVVKDSAYFGCEYSSYTKDGFGTGWKRDDFYTMGELTRLGKL